MKIKYWVKQSDSEFWLLPNSAIKDRILTAKVQTQDFLNVSFIMVWDPNDFIHLTRWLYIEKLKHDQLCCDNYLKAIIAHLILFINGISHFDIM